MCRFLQLGVVYVLLATAAVGCGGSGKELAPAATTPKIDHAEVQRKMDESKNRMQKPGAPTAPSAAPSGPPEGTTP